MGWRSGLFACALAASACDGGAGGPGLPREPVRLLAGHPAGGRARLVGAGPSSCSQPTPDAPAADRWCALSVPSAEAGATELWALNVTRAGAGDDIACDGSSLHCVRLTGNLWTGEPFQGPSHPFAHRFEGSTLIFHADAHSKPDDLYEGPVWAWRPGWRAPRVITSERGVTCSGHPRAAVALCIDTVTMGKRIEFDLLAGPLTDGDEPLPRLAHVIPLRANESIAWRSGFSPRGDYFVLSSIEAGSDKEVVRVGRTADLGRAPLREVAFDATQFEISHDGKKLFYLQGFNYDIDGKPAGTLTMADFPGGENAVALQQKVGSFSLLGQGEDERGLAFTQDVKDDVGAFRVLPDRAHPERVLTIADEIEPDDITVSPDGRYSVFAQYPAAGDPQTVIVPHDGSPSCVLGSRPGSQAFDIQFTPGGGLVFWSEEAEDPDDGDEAFVARPDCTGRQRFATRVQYMDAAADRLLLFAVANEDEQLPGATLKIARLPGGQQWPAEGAITLGAGVDDFISTLVSPATAQVIFQIADGAEERQGIYRFGPFSLDR